MSLSNLVYGFGVYDRSGPYVGTINKAQTREYKLWISMLSRCYGGERLNRFPSYIGCSVHQDFIHFQDFAKWCHHQPEFYNDGWHLDKDILISGNKVYGPDTCCFVPGDINTLFTQKRSNCGIYPTGVNFHKASGKYIAQIKLGGKQTYLGIFETPERAESAYKTAKYSEIHRLANVWRQDLDPRIYTAILNYRI